MKHVFARFPDGVPVLDPVKDMKVKGAEYNKLLERKSVLQQRLLSHCLIQQVKEQKKCQQGAFSTSKEDENLKTQNTIKN